VLATPPKKVAECPRKNQQRQKKSAKQRETADKQPVVVAERENLSPEPIELGKGKRKPKMTQRMQESGLISPIKSKRTRNQAKKALQASE
jgi:hypothetical protein